MLSSPITAQAARATIVFIALVTDIYATAVAYGHGLLTHQLLARSLMLMVPMAVGIALGNGHFLNTPAETFRRFALLLLMFLAGASLVRALVGVT